MKKVQLLLVAVLCLAVSFALAQDKTKKDKPKEITVTGRITDVKCHLNGMAESMGEDHKQCAVECIKNGLPVGILEDKTEKLYFVVPSKGMKPGNEELVKFADEKVKLTGTLLEKNGAKMFTYTKVEEVK
jgi:hypothetical protein